MLGGTPTRDASLCEDAEVIFFMKVLIIEVMRESPIFSFASFGTPLYHMSRYIKMGTPTALRDRTDLSGPRVCAVSAGYKQSAYSQRRGPVSTKTEIGGDEGVRKRG